MSKRNVLDELVKEIDYRLNDAVSAQHYWSKQVGLEAAVNARVGSGVEQTLRSLRAMVDHLAAQPAPRPAREKGRRK